ncbi:hypothetical protein [Arthrobacter sp. NPDC058192]|uniref:hypothetical protein n=1 Tax=Arthrobacter sp. NPDC058192 TaxID=3346372 RepID=UPI0036E011AC
MRPLRIVTAEDGTLVREQFLALTRRVAAAVLLEITGVDSVSRDAVRVFSEPRPSRPVRSRAARLWTASLHTVGAGCRWPNARAGTSPTNKKPSHGSVT